MYEVERRHRVYPSPEHLWRVLQANHDRLVMSNDVDWPDDYFVGEPVSEGFIADIELLIDCLALDQRPDNSLIAHPSGGTEYRRRVGSLPPTLGVVVDALWRILEPPQKVPRHVTYLATPDKPSQ